MRRTAFISILTFVLLVLPVTAKLPAHVESIKPLYVGEQAVCTTWALNKKAGLWMTAAHCVAFWADIDGEWTMVRYANLVIAGKPATIVKVDPEDDLALLHADVHERGFRIGNYPSVGDEVTVYGFPGGWISPIPTWLHVSNTFMTFEGTARAWMLLDGSVWPGHSGSPIINKHGKVIGVVQAHGTDRYAGATFASAWTDFHAFIAGFTE